ncbi:hypothetical protein [Shewanella violacea]|uniref:Uncharacterized protein n=1 Tax=Shewanella violacea (strain JCM 10179 / CIP 106290 / LMG 19151 / DSS12) TaxID=637905 RepID=D4ZG92_SHEVD|nr:hypothetical protein [Shewanella violacea]BAJ00691.1 hypothetical protein SVI_0720 [Shewanella violacea DSS12]
MNYFSKHYPVARFRIWHISLVLFGILLVILFLHAYALNSAGINLTCRGNAFAANPADDLSLELKVKSKDKKVTLNYSFISKGLNLGGMEFRGRLDKLEVASMTYKLNIDEGDFRLNFGHKVLPSYMESFIDSASNALANSHSVKLDIHVLDMDTSNNYTAIQFIPGNSIWICELE